MEDPLELRLRLSTSLLCKPSADATLEEKDSFVWKLFEQVEENNFNPSLPMLFKAQEKWTRVVQSFKDNSAHASGYDSSQKSLS